MGGKGSGWRRPRLSLATPVCLAGAPLYSLVIGAIGSSHAFAAAEREGLPAEVLTRARQLMPDEEGDGGAMRQEMEVRPRHSSMALHRHSACAREREPGSPPCAGPLAHPGTPARAQVLLDALQEARLAATADSDAAARSRAEADARRAAATAAASLHASEAWLDERVRRLVRHSVGIEPSALMDLPRRSARGDARGCADTPRRTAGGSGRFRMRPPLIGDSRRREGGSTLLTAGCAISCTDSLTAPAVGLTGHDGRQAAR